MLTKDAIRERNRIRKIEWRNNNRDKVREKQKQWDKNHPEIMKKSKAKYYNTNKEKLVKTALKKYHIKIQTIPEFKENIKKRDKQYRTTLREKFFSLYGSVCACCGESHIEFLTIEHKLGRKNKRETSTLAYKLALQEYRPDLYETLCMNCNHSKGIRGYCPHQHNQ